MVLLPPPLQLFVRGLGPRGSSYCRARATSNRSSGRTQHCSWAKDVISPACPVSALGSSPCWTCLKHLPRDALMHCGGTQNEGLSRLRHLFLMWRRFLYFCSCVWMQQPGLSPPALISAIFLFFFFTNWPQLVIMLEMQNKRRCFHSKLCVKQLEALD